MTGGPGSGRKSFADGGGVRITFLREGSGTPMVLIHGMTTAAFLWKEMIPLLSGSHDVVAPDLMGCGDSAKPGEADYSIASQAGIVRGLIDTLGLGRVHLGGHDIGGGIAQILAVSDPGRYRSLTLVNSVGYDYWPVQPIVTMRVPILRLIALATFDLGVLRALIKRGFYHREKVDNAMMDLFQGPLRNSEGRAGFLSLARGLDNSHLMAVAGLLPALPMPVLIVRGGADIYLKPVIAERLHREIPGSRYEEIPTAGHFTPLDEPGLLAGMIAEFAASSASD